MSFQPLVLTILDAPVALALRVSRGRNYTLNVMYNSLCCRDISC